MYKKIMTVVLKALIKAFHVKNIDLFFKNTFKIINIIGSIICMAIIYWFAIGLEQVISTTICFLVIKYISNLHYNKYTECTMATTIVMVTFMLWRMYFSVHWTIDIFIVIGIGLFFRKYKT